MAVTKRTRFEVLRRDGFACQYCGTKATESGDGLTIDHVVPVSLGGADDPANLVAACRECNAGKSSIQPDSPLVQELGAAAKVYTLAMMQRMAEIGDELAQDAEMIEYFESVWFDYADVMGRTKPLPDDYRQSLRKWAGMGVPMSLIEYAIEVAMTNRAVRGPDKFRYMAGVIYRKIDARELDTTVTARTARCFTYQQVQDEHMRGYQEGYEAGQNKGYDAGMNDGYGLAETIAASRDHLAAHIDGGVYA